MAIGKKIGFGVGIVIIIIVIAGLLMPSRELQEPSSDLPILDLEISKFEIWKQTKKESPYFKIPYREKTPSLFETYVYVKDTEWANDTLIGGTWQFELKDESIDLYEEIALWNDPQNTVVINPVFTSSAYGENGFYWYYHGFCDVSCLTTKIVSNITKGHSGSQHAVKVLSLLGYSIITDIELDKNPKVLQEYDKVILLHSEYVTKNEFKAIVNHSNVVYLYPNALFAEIKTNYEENTVTLIRGHNYPDKEIRNGFDWKFDNSNLEYDLVCEDWNFYKIDNGVMLNCYPEIVIFSNFELLKAIKEL